MRFKKEPYSTKSGRKRILRSTPTIS